jgi:sugar/nucleoside kinase (ribokinase family)
MPTSMHTLNTLEPGSRPMAGNYDVLLPGDYFSDLVFTGLSEVPRLGAEIWSCGFAMTPGGPFTTTVAMQRLGLRVGWMCDFGTDFFSRYVLEAARQQGIDDGLFQIHPYPVRRVSVAFPLLGDRGFLSFADDIQRASPIAAIEQHRPRCVLLPHLHYGEDFSELFAIARRAGSVLFMDCQGMEVTLETPGVTDALCSVDVFAPNEAEALQLTGAATIEEALSQLAQLTPLVVVKLGSRGAICRKGVQAFHVPAIPVNAVDTTGAGDCFNAGFLYGYLRGESLEICLQSGNICGGLSTTAVGGMAAAPTTDQVEAFRASLTK